MSAFCLRRNVSTCVPLRELVCPLVGRMLMRRMLMITVAVAGLTGQAVAQTLPGSSSTNTPPSPNSSMAMPQPSGSLPPGASTSSQDRPGDSLGQQSSGGRALSGVRPMRGQQREAASDGEHGQPAPTRRSDRGGREAVASTGEYDGGRGMPLSARASNIVSSDTHSETAPRLPAPDTAGSSPEDFLRAAQRALAAGRTGQAQEALERAETRLLTRSTSAGDASVPDGSPMVKQISEARTALGRRDTAAARQAITTAIGGQSGSGSTAQ